jgi:non-specific serine/threonine protein kinase
LVSKIHFHLAINADNHLKPFAFLATCAFKDPNKERIQHIPLGRAVQNKAAMRDVGGLESLLNPLRNVAKMSQFFDDLLIQKKVFQACEFTAAEAFYFLDSVSVYQQEGIVVKVPKIWDETRPPKAKVNVQLREDSTSKKGKLGMAGVFRLDTSVTIGGRTLTADELNKLLEEEGPLLFFGGQWIEVDRNQIESILERLKKRHQYPASKYLLLKL